jgi:hypothetical protein
MMNRPRVKAGLIVGLIGLVLNVFVATLFGFCGPLFTLLAGALAGFWAARQERMPAKGDGARLGAVAGAITGGLMLIGQVLGGIDALLLTQYSGMRPLIGSVPEPSADISQQILYYGAGLLTGMCFGVVGVALAVLAGAGGGYIGTPASQLSDL